MEWQPIETAPKDGVFLGVRKEEGKPIRYWVISGLHMEYAYDDKDTTKGLTWNSVDGMYGIRLTHWMPLPQPPK
jgi:hypothetical protein